MASARAAVKAALLKQFGAAARAVIDHEVESQLGGKSRVGRSDLEKVELSIIAALRDKREQVTTTASMSFSASVPTLRQADPQAHSQLSSEGFAGGSLTVPSLAAASTGELHSSSMPSLGLRTMPTRPKMKCVDHFDLMAEYVGKQQQQEDASKDGAQKVAYQTKLLSRLNESLSAKQAFLAQEAELQRKDKQVFKLAVEKEEAKQAEERRQGEARFLVRKQQNQETLARSERQRRAEVEQRRRTAAADSEQIEKEKEMFVREKEKKLQDTAQRKKEMQEMLDLVKARKDRERKEAADWDARIERQAAKAADDRAGEHQKRVAKNQARVDHIYNTLGAAVVGRKARAQQELEERNERYRKARFEQQDRDAELKRERARNQVQKMVGDWAVQLEEIRCRGIEEKEADKKQLEIWTKEDEAFHAKEAAKLARLRSMRNAVDDDCFRTMQQTMPIHKAHFTQSEKTRREDSGMNRQLLDEIMQNGFRSDVAGVVLQGKTAPMCTTIRGKTVVLKPSW
eukprot:TRINITY_DN81207_c0_g1_i1.p1 TRINITY_DN81207_c0_g1~~TRINITY_DN81207_c0_g1_i1.p1  ORF type:complete len:514 (-),score=152.22 TRINITY_DN81207_c0_g1_i1:196-1737(-)